MRVVFADDNYLVREGVAGLLAETAEIDLVETVADPDALLTRRGRAPAGRRAHRHPDAADVHHRGHRRGQADPGRVPRRPGWWCCRSTSRRTTPSSCSSDGVAGLGYLLKERVTQVDELVRALHDVARGGSALDPKVVEGLLARKSSEASSPLLGLTEREREVLQELATGRSNAATAKALFMSERAVEKHVGSVFQKLGLVHESDVNRRVMAVLAFLEATGGGAGRTVSGTAPPGRAGSPLPGRRPRRATMAAGGVAWPRSASWSSTTRSRSAARWRAVVEETDGFVVVGSATSGEESLAAAAELRPDLVLMDVNLPGIDGIEATRRLTSGAGRPGRGAALDLRRGPVRPRRLRCCGVRRQGRVRSGPALSGLGRRRRLARTPAGPRRPGCVTVSRPGPDGERAAGGGHPVDDRLPVERRRPAPPSTRRTRSVPDRGTARPRPARDRSARPRRSRSRPPPRPAAENRRPAADGSTRQRGRRARSGARSDRSAGSSPARASWVGNTPRVSSRSDSRAVFVLGDQERRCRSSGRPPRRRPGTRSSSSGSATRWGSTSREMAASRARRAASSASMIRARDSRQLAGGAVELGHVPGQLGLQRGVAEGDRGLVGQGREQPLVGGAQRAALGHCTSMLPRTAPPLPDRDDVRGRCRPRRRRPTSR